MKKKAISSVWGLCLLFSLAGCKETAPQVEEIYLEGHAVFEEMDGPYMRLPYRVGIEGGRMVLLDLASDSMFYHVYSYPEIAYLYSIGKKGDGPNEMVLPTPFQLYGKQFVFLDGAKSELHYYQRADSGKMELTRKWNLEMPLTVDFAVVDDTTVVVENMNGDSRLIEITPTQRIKKFKISCEEENGEANTARLWRSLMDYDAMTGYVVMATQMGDVLEIYDLKEDSVKKVVTGETGTPRVEQQIEGYHDVKWKDGCIYALYSGRSKDELNKKFNAGQREPDGGNLIKVYSSDGLLLKLYHLDSYINGFTFDKDKIVGITSNSDSPVILFELKR